MDFKTSIIYLTVLVLVFIFSALISTANTKSFNRLCLVLVILFLSFLSGLRGYSVGSDSYTYAQEFAQGNRGTIEFEPLFSLFVLTLSKFTKSYTVLFIIVALITNSLIVVRLQSFSKQYPLSFSIVVYYCLLYFRTFSGMRQLLAVAIIFWGSKFLFCSKPKWINFSIVLTIAFLIHYSSIISLLLLIPFGFKKTKSFWGKLFKVIIILAAPFLVIVGYGLMMNKYGAFFTTTNSKPTTGIMLAFRFALLLLICIGYIRLKKNDSGLSVEKDNKNLQIPTIVLCLYEFLYLLFTSFDLIWPSVGRMAWYFALFTPLIYSMVLRHQSIRGGISLIARPMVVLVVGYHLWGVLNSTSTNLVPYVFFWQI